MRRSPLDYIATLILLQSPEYPPEVKAKQVKAKSSARNLRRLHEGITAEELKEGLHDKMQRAMTVASEKGASSWLLTLPIAGHGFDLHKGAFRDALCLQYGWRPHFLYHHTVSVIKDWPLNMYSAAAEEDSLQSDTMRLGTRQPTSWLRCAMEWVSNPACNQWQRSSWPTNQQTQKMGPTLTSCLRMSLGAGVCEEAGKQHTQTDGHTKHYKELDLADGGERVCLH